MSTGALQYVHKKPKTIFAHLFNATERIHIEVASKIETDAISTIDLICGQSVLVQHAAIGHRVHGYTAA